MNSELFNLTGKTALITGGSKGLGFQIAETASALGANIILLARKHEELEIAAETLRAKGAQVKAIPFDLQKLNLIPDMVSEAALAFGPIDILVNNAGTSWAAPAQDYPLKAWEKVMTLNVTVPFLLSQEIAKTMMIPRRSGKIVNIASIGGLRGNRPDLGMYTIAYNTSKAALINLSRALASEWGKYDINVNTLCPGFFPSKMSATLLEDISETLLPSIPLGRLGGDDDLRGPIALLMCEAGRHITGQCLSVDGGATAV